MVPTGPEGAARRREFRFDLVLALVLGGIFIPATAFFANRWAPDDRLVDPPAMLLVTVAFLSLIFRRRRPFVTLGIVTLSTTAYLWASYPYGPILGAFFVAVYTVAATMPFVPAAVAAVLAGAVLITHVFVHPNSLGGWLGLIPGAAWAVVPFAIGLSVRTARQARRASQDETLRQHLYNERMQLAQEVHDVVGHGLAAIQLQADIALHVDEHQPPRTREALEAISDASRAAVAELATTLEAIHPDRRSSTPGVEDIKELCERTRKAGVEVDLTVDGRTEMRHEQAELVAYRVVQEALTNVIRHGQVPRATVKLELGDEAIDVQVINPVTSPRSFESGRGTSGMRSRVEGVGGSFTSGPTSDGFAVEARIPYRGST